MPQIRKKSKAPTLNGFFWAITHNWFQAMSGGLSVPFTLVGYFVSNPMISHVFFVAGYVCLLAASYKVWSVERDRVIELEKVGPEDLETMLNGRYIGETFVYGGDYPRLCKSYNTKHELEILTRGFEFISVPAPSFSLSHIRLTFSHSRVSDDCAFFVRDELGLERRIENIYERVPIRLDNLSQFALKLVCSPYFDLDKATLMISIEAWEK